MFVDFSKRAPLTAEPEALSVGAIAGIAVICGLMFFGALTFLVICCSRRRHRKKRLASGRKLDLGEDVEDDIRAEQRQRPHDLALSRSVSSNPFFNESDQKLNEWYRRTQGENAQKNENGDIIPPAYAFHITAIRDSWPLVSWSTSPKVGGVESPPMPTAPAAVAIANRQYAPSTQGGPAPYPYPHDFPVRPPPQKRGPPVQAKHARKKSRSSISSIRRRSSHTDTQLTTILRSTSQRLRDAHAAGNVSPSREQPKNARVSILSPLFGKPPSQKAPSPPKAMNGNESRQDLVESPVFFDESRCSSPKSSVLDLFHGDVRARTPQNGILSDDEDDVDSLCGVTPDFETHPSLTSPSRHQKLFERRQHIRNSSGHNSGTKIHEDNRASLVPFGAHDILATAPRSLRTLDRKNTPSNEDPFVTATSAAAKANPSSRSLLLNRPDLQPRKTTFGEILPLRSVVNNNQMSLNDPEPIKRSIVNRNSELLEQPFQWTANPTDFSRNGHPQIIIGDMSHPRAKGHKRSKVVCSPGRPPSRNSINIVPEEFDDDEDASVVGQTGVWIPTDVSQLTAPQSPSSVYASCPPSMANFQFQPAADSSTLREMPGRASRISYSATLSLYDMYSSPQAARNPSRSRSPDRQRKRSSSVMSVTVPLGSGQVSPRGRRSTVSSVGSAAYNPIMEQQSHPFQYDQAVSTAPLVPGPPRTLSMVLGPHESPRLVDRDSVQHAVGLLRRMNSTVSIMSAHESIASEGSPSIPAYRGGGCGVSATKSFRRGSTNYLSLAKGTRTSSNRSSAYSRRTDNDKENVGRLSRGQSMQMKKSASKNALCVMEELETPESEAESFFATTLRNSAVSELPLPNPSWTDLKPVKSSPTLGGAPTYGQGNVEQTAGGNSEGSARKDSGIGLRKEGKREAPKSGTAARYGNRKVKKEPKRAEYTESLYDENGFLRSSPERGGPGMI